MKVTNLKSWVIILGLTLSTIFSQTFREVRPESVGLSSKRLERLTNKLDNVKLVSNKMIQPSDSEYFVLVSSTKEFKSDSFTLYKSLNRNNNYPESKHLH